MGASANRRAYIDWMRGLSVLFMIEWHIRPFPKLSVFTALVYGATLLKSRIAAGWKARRAEALQPA